MALSSIFGRIGAGLKRAAPYIAPVSARVAASFGNTQPLQMEMYEKEQRRKQLLEDMGLERQQRMDALTQRQADSSMASQQSARNLAEFQLGEAKRSAGLPKPVEGVSPRGALLRQMPDGSIQEQVMERPVSAQENIRRGLADFTPPLTRKPDVNAAPIRPITMTDTKEQHPIFAAPPASAFNLNPDALTYRQLLQEGKSPIEALEAVKGAGRTEPVGSDFERALQERRKTDPDISTIAFRREWMAAGREPDASDTGDYEALADAVEENPSILSNLTGTTRRQLEPLLASRGFTDFTKALSDGAIAKIAESNAAKESLKDLRTVLQENEQYIGPLAGFQSLNPWSDARQAQARIDLVKQRVGKTLEGGVLRKEDEEKYKRILATLFDTPTTAISKVDGLIQTLERDIDLYKQEQARAGRRINLSAAPSAGTSNVPTYDQYGNRVN